MIDTKTLAHKPEPLQIADLEWNLSPQPSEFNINYLDEVLWFKRAVTMDELGIFATKQIPLPEQIVIGPSQKWRMDATEVEAALGVTFRPAVNQIVIITPAKREATINTIYRDSEVHGSTIVWVEASVEIESIEILDVTITDMEE